MQPKIAFDGQTKKGVPIMIRYPQIEDLGAMLAYINTLSKEQTFIRFQGEELKREDEEKYLNELLEKITQHRSMALLAFSDGRLIGLVDVNLKDKIESHEGVFGLTVAEEFRDKGIGTKLMEVLMEEITQMPELKIITLGVFANNPRAEELYKKFGFSEFGRLPKGIFYKGRYVDHIFMYKNVDE